MIMVVSVIVCGLVALFGVLPAALAYRARRLAKTAQTSPWLNNDRATQALLSQPAPNKPFTFAVLGDVQSGVPMFTRIIEACKREHQPVFFVQTGDLAARPRPGHFSAVISRLVRHIDRPFFVTPGNHDVRVSTRALTPKPYFEAQFGSGQFQFEYGGVLFIFLDNSMGPLGTAQYTWLEEILESNEQAKRPVLLFMHAEPIYWEGNGRPNFEGLYVSLFELLERRRVAYIFTGNWHGYHREERNGTIYVVNGRGGDFDHDNRLVKSHVTIVECSETGITDRAVDFSGSPALAARSWLLNWYVTRWGNWLIRN